MHGTYTVVDVASATTLTHNPSPHTPPASLAMANQGAPYAPNLLHHHHWLSVNFECERAAAVSTQHFDIGDYGNNHESRRGLFLVSDRCATLFLLPNQGGHRACAAAFLHLMIMIIGQGRRRDDSLSSPPGLPRSPTRSGRACTGSMRTRLVC